MAYNRKRRNKSRVKNKKNTKYKHKLKPTKEYKPIVLDWTRPSGSADVDACKERVANGMKCYCLDVCQCRNCDGCSVLEHPGDCYAPCRTCSNHKPCR